MYMGSLTFAKLNFEQLCLLVQWAEKEGWNPGVNDAAVFWQTDPDGFYGYFLENEMIAGGSIVSYGGQFGFMGFFIVQPQYRGAGIGRKLWYQRRDSLLARLQKGATIGMDGVVAMQPFYKKGGFDISFRDGRYMRTGEAFKADDRVSALDAQDLPLLLPYDQQCFGFERERFLRAWVLQPSAKSFKLVEDGQLKGFATLRKAATGYKIGPLFADDAAIAETLYKTCLSAAPGEPVFIDIPQLNAGAVALVEKYNTNYVFECARMYYGPPPPYCLEKIFGVSSFELG